jgi:hypothetical protein
MQVQEKIVKTEQERVNLTRKIAVEQMRDWKFSDILELEKFI